VKRDVGADTVPDVPYINAGTKLNLVAMEWSREGDAHLAWRGWTLSEGRDVVTQHFVGTMAIAEVPARVNLHVELMHTAEITGDEPVPYDLPIVIEIPAGRSREFPFTMESENTPGVNDEWFVIDTATVLGNEFGAEAQVVAVHDGVGPLLRVAGMALVGWHLLANEWRMGNGDEDDPRSIETKPWTPGGENEVIELSQVTVVTATVGDRLSLRGNSVSDMYAMERPSLMTPQWALSQLVRRPPTE
jgi:hypothetical protein